MEDNLIRTFLAVPLPNEIKGKKNMFFSTIDQSKDINIVKYGVRFLIFIPIFKSVNS